MKISNTIGMHKINEIQAEAELMKTGIFLAVPKKKICILA